MAVYRQDIWEASYDRIGVGKMNPLAFLFNRTLPDVLELGPSEALAATLKPRPDLRDRRFANWSMARRERYLAASYGVPYSLRTLDGDIPS